MAKLTFKSGRRGRPLTLDTEAALKDIYKALPRAKQALAEFRRTTSGVRDEALLGSQTTLPEWLNMAIDAVEYIPTANYNYSMVKDIRSAIKIAKRLASKREDISTTALEEQMTTDYLEGLETAQGYSSQFAKEQLRRISNQVKNMTKQERIAFFKSKRYQDIGTFGKKQYRKIKAWAEASSGREMSYKEAYAYLIAQRAEVGLETAEEIHTLAGGIW